MAEEQNGQPIIVKRKKRGHGGHHGGAWKVAFADFMTAMMAFFLVMWAVGQSDEIKESVAGYFRDPGKFMKEGHSGMLDGSTSVIKAESDNLSMITPPVEKDAVPTADEQSQLSLAGRKILEQLSEQEVFGRLHQNIKVQMTSEGLRIILNESENSPAFFEPGSTKLLQKSAVILITIAKELGRLDNRLIIEGHTDAAYTGQGDYSNWELSTDRANAARQLMEVSGLRKNQVREVRGFADQFPMIEDDPTDARNRRITIVVLYEFRELQYDQIEVGGDLMADMF